MLSYHAAPPLALCVPLLLVALFAAPARTATWEEVQDLKRNYLEMAARNAIDQQKTSEAAPIAIPFPEDVASHGSLKLTRLAADRLTVQTTADPKTYRIAAGEFIRIKLPQPMDMVARHSGLALIVQTTDTTSPEVRLGCRLIAPGGMRAVILPSPPVLSRWGDNPHEIYLDWAFLNYADVNQAVGVLQAVETIEITFASALRAPQRGASRSDKPARLTLSNLRLVDYLKGSYDPSRRSLRFDDRAMKWVPGTKKDLTLQHRCQEVTGIVARFGGEPGARSAVDALDMAARTQCWDGSFLDGRRGANTVTSGEYTFGFTLYGLLSAYTALQDRKAPALDEKIAIGPATMTRHQAYRRMFYRGAMSRAAIATPATYRDDIIGGNTLITGANRVLGYAIAMRMIADVLPNRTLKNRVLAAYAPLIKEIADAQGKFSGGFPLLGEGDKYGGKGIHYDGGYIRTHMDWLVLGVRRTGDPFLVRMLRRYQTVFEAAMNRHGTGLKKLISERHAGGGDVQLIIPDATAQVGIEHQLPLIAQWGYNCGIPVWTNWEHRTGNHFTFASHTRGYSLGAHTSILVDDIDPAPRPKDLGYLFPRQYPIWSSRLLNTAGRLQRVSKVTVRTDGTMHNDFVIDVGEYPVTVGVPVTIKASGADVVATADKLSGWPKLLPEGAQLRITSRNWPEPRDVRIGEPVSITLTRPDHLVIIGPQVTLPPEAGGQKVPFRAELTLEKAPAAQGHAVPEVQLTVLRGTVPYEHAFVH